MKKYILLLLALIGTNQILQAQDDKYIWLEEVDGKKALEFVKTQNKATVDKLSSEKDYQEIYDQSLEIFNSKEKIAYPNVYGNYVFNFWKDKDHIRGIWRRCSLESYTNGNPKWETLLDIDELSKKDDIKWVYKGASGLYPDFNRFLVKLSKGGGDAVVTKEFDINKKQFVENGFFIAESKGSANYIDDKTLIVTSDFGEGTMTTSGYPRQVKVWKRGTLLKDAQLIFEGDSTDVSVQGYVTRDGSKQYTLVRKGVTFYARNTFIWKNDKLIQLDIPEDAETNGILKNQMLVQLKSDWTVNSKTYKTGTLLSINFTELLKGNKEIEVVLVPDEFSSILGIRKTKNKLLVNVLKNVVGQLYIYSFSNGKWSNQKVDTLNLGAIYIKDTNSFTDQFFFSFENFITPSTLYTADASNNTFNAYKSLPAYFDASKYEVHQYKATSKDGTMIPYFMVSAKGIKKDGSNPTLVYAYGGFEVSLTPFYAPTFGVSWLEKGGVFVMANLRGGGEFGPKWHQDGIKEKRQNVYDDLYAVSEDLIAKKVTSPKHLGLLGGSNGGLLVGVAFTQRPDLYNAIVCEVPLLDMKRYHKLLAGASWMGEFGNPDIPEEWEYIKKYSPYQNLKEGMKYPEVYFGTSTRDDRVHPGHARKMVAKMNAMGYKTYYYENTEGGHAGSSTNEQRAKSNALMFSYLLMKLK
ncbi:MULTISPECIES: prolyl oligopeptidase family serine peptidase [unclassified Polaribacter]|uniref:prolyl oligopeptidase family serine peptidase n=1 Tax=unclassified Polaribacter TaxID=196858 RepID=UPI0011BDB38D|nr:MULTISPECIES: prolyl oligopeptidase family serine peptidase [unclassified Polaribacter]TXD51386.1 S9 family peptidase [Polaribacter sp. IC063]TXD62309.1 S9 family peptidase [Polaribacter sp. IC066]